MASTLTADNGVSSGTSGIKYNGDATGVLAFQTTTSGGTATTAITIDNNQNVGIGTSSPSNKLTISSTATVGATTLYSTGTTTGYNAFAINNTGNTAYFAVDNVAGTAFSGSSAYATVVGSNASYNLNFITGATVRATIDTGGNFLVGTTSVSATPTQGCQLIGTATGQLSVGHASGTASGNYYASFAYNGSAIGSITQSGTTAVLYNTTSDIRLKNDQGVAQKSRINDVVIHDFIWKADGSQDRGVFAQELAEVIPNAVAKGKTEDDYWQVDYSKLVPDLVVCCQEQQALITTLQTQVAALQAKVGA
jgi:hypothetical protein